MAIKSSQNSRKDSRTPVTILVEVTHDELGSFDLKTRDMSNGGIFVIMDEDHGLLVGHTVLVKVKGRLGDGEEPPTLEMKIVRTESEGLGLKFV